MCQAAEGAAVSNRAPGGHLKCSNKLHALEDASELSDFIHDAVYEL